MGDYRYTSAGFMISTGYLDTVADIEPGRTVAAVPAGQNTFGGQLGKIFCCDDVEAARLSSVPATLTLLGGDYQYVRMTTSIATAAAIGIPLYWVTPGSFLVTTVATSANIYAVAGFCLGVLPIANSYFFMQVAGAAPVLYQSSPGATTLPACVFINSTNANCNTVAGASLTAADQSLKVGNAVVAPVSAAVGTVFLQEGGALQRYY
jgi:hypothetical protein